MLRSLRSKKSTKIAPCLPDTVGITRILDLFPRIVDHVGIIGHMITSKQNFGQTRLNGLVLEVLDRRGLDRFSSLSIERVPVPTLIIPLP